MKKPRISFEMNLPKTIYGDIVDMPANMVLGVNIRYYNSTTQNLYFKFFGNATGWGSNSVELGLLNAGQNAYINMDDFLSRSTPAAAVEETIHFVLKAYTDAGYTTDAFEFSRDTTVKLIKSDDGSWTEDEHDDFEADVDGWAYVYEAKGHTSNTASLSSSSGQKTHGSKSLRCNRTVYYDNDRQDRIRLWKSYTTTNLRDTIYAIINYRCDPECGVFGCPPPSSPKAQLKYLQVTRDAILLMHFGESYDAVESDYFPRGKWMRIVVPLPKNTTLELRVINDINYWSTGTGKYVYDYLDDVKIISK